MARKFDAVNEQVVLVSMARSPELLQAAAGSLKEDDFIGERHRATFVGLVEASRRGFDPSAKNVALFAGQRDFGGLEYLEELFAKAGAAATPKEFAYHVDVLRKDAARFRVARSVRGLEEVMLDKTRSYDDCGLELERVFGDFRAVGSGQVCADPGLVPSWLEDFEERVAGKRRAFRPTGLDAMDEVLTEGFAPGGITLFAGRPRMGKTVTWTDLTRRILAPSDRPRILVIPFEKGRGYYLNMLISSVAKVELEDIVKSPEALTEAELLAVRKATDWVGKRVAEGTLTVLDNPALGMFDDEKWGNRRSLDEIERILAVGRYDVAFFDLLERAFIANLDAQKISQALARLQVMCRRYGLHMVVTQQLRRSAEDLKMSGKRRPTLTDLKNSGGYEEIVDHVFLIHREKVYKPLLGKDLLELKLAKQKIGEAGMTLVADFLPGVCRIAKDRIVKAGDAVGREMFKEGDGDD